MPKILPDLKQRLLEGMQQLLQEEGYGAVTIRSVAKRCSVGVGTVYNYFPSKEALLAEYLLTDWRGCIAAIEAAGAHADTAEPVARCIYDQLLRFANSHMAIFSAEGARQSFTGSFSPYHGLLRSQLATPLRRFCDSDFAAEFVSEAMLTWSMAGKEFCEIWGMLCPLIKEK